MPDHDDESVAGEPVGSLAEEAARLIAAMVTGSAGSAATLHGSDASSDQEDPQAGDASGHTCPHGWCPLCQAVEYVQDHPEVVTQVLVAGAEFLKVVRDAVEKVAGSPPEEPA